MKRCHRTSSRRAVPSFLLGPAIAALALVAGLSGAAWATGAATEFEVDGLHGTLAVPAPRGPFPAALIIVGSGPTNRDGNSSLGLKTDMYRLLSDALVANGIACARYDKRGIGASSKAGPPEEELRIGEFADDALAIASWLGRQPNVSGISLVGHSEGGLLALMGAARVKPKAVVLLATPGRKFAALLRDQFGRPGLPAGVAAEAQRVISDLERGDAVGEVSPMLRAVFRPSVQPFLKSLMAIDPAQLIERLEQPVMIVGGGRDLQVGRTDFDTLAATRPDAEAYWDPSMGHTLKSTRSAPEAYTNPRKPLAAGLAERIADFIKLNSQ
jgi:pimeloyl-ACP methyl ester carboxylesterase